MGGQAMALTASAAGEVGEDGGKPLVSEYSLGGSAYLESLISCWGLLPAASPTHLHAGNVPALIR